MKAFEIRKSRHGKGVFACKDFKKGEKIYKFSGKIYKFYQIRYGTYIDIHCFQISDSEYMGPSGKFDDFFNHSCNPNAIIRLCRKRPILLALKNIKKGSEITFDYSTWTEEKKWKMFCSCGSKNCRRIIRSFSMLPEKIKKKYIRLDAVGKFVNKN